MGFKVEDPEFVEIAQDNVARTAGNEARPVFKGLAVMLGEINATLFHFDEDDGFPDQIGKGGAAAVFFDAVLAGGSRFFEAGMTEGAKQVIEENLRLAFFVAGNVGGTPVDEGFQLDFARVHGWALSLKAVWVGLDFSLCGAVICHLFFRHYGALS